MSTTKRSTGAGAGAAASNTSSAGSTALPANASQVQAQLQSSFSTLLHNYRAVPARLKLIDSFLLFFILSGVLQFAYRLLVTRYPYNAFIGGYVLRPLFSPPLSADEAPTIQTES